MEHQERKRLSELCAVTGYVMVHLGFRAVGEGREWRDWLPCAAGAQLGMSTGHCQGAGQAKSLEASRHRPVRYCLIAVF